MLYNLLFKSTIYTMVINIKSYDLFYGDYIRKFEILYYYNWELSASSWKSVFRYGIKWTIIWLFRYIKDLRYRGKSWKRKPRKRNGSFFDGFCIYEIQIIHKVRTLFIVNLFVSVALHFLGRLLFIQLNYLHSSSSDGTAKAFTIKYLNRSPK